MKFAITDHAVERFCQRIDPSKSLTEAHEILTAKAPRSALMRQRSILGQDLRTLDNPDCILVCKQDQGLYVVVTVFDRQETEFVDVSEVVDAFRRANASKIANKIVTHFRAPSMREQILEMVNREIDSRIDKFVDARRAVLNHQQNLAEAKTSKVLKEERLRSQLYQEQLAYAAMVKATIPRLYRLAKENTEAREILEIAIRTIPSLAGLCRD